MKTTPPSNGRSTTMMMWTTMMSNHDDDELRDCLRDSLCYLPELYIKEERPTGMMMKSCFDAHFFALSATRMSWHRSASPVTAQAPSCGFGSWTQLQTIPIVLIKAIMLLQIMHGLHLIGIEGRNCNDFVCAAGGGAIHIGITLQSTTWTKWATPLWLPCRCVHRRSASVVEWS